MGAVEFTTPKGNKAILIPLEGNNFYISGKNITQDLIEFEKEVQNEKTLQTHILKISKKKDQEGVNNEIVGSIEVWKQEKKEAVTEPVKEMNDDLPF